MKAESSRKDFLHKAFHLLWLWKEFWPCLFKWVFLWIELQNNSLLWRLNSVFKSSFMRPFICSVCEKNFSLVYSNRFFVNRITSGVSILVLVLKLASTWFWYWYWFWNSFCWVLVLVLVLKLASAGFWYSFGIGFET